MTPRQSNWTVLTSVSPYALPAPNHFGLQQSSTLSNKRVWLAYAVQFESLFVYFTAAVKPSERSTQCILTAIDTDLVKATHNLLDCGAIPYLKDLHFRGEW